MSRSKMSRFKDREEQLRFIRRSDAVFRSLISKIPEKDQQEAVEIVQKLYTDWNQIFILPPEKNPTDSTVKNKKNIEKLYKELKESVEKNENCPYENISMSTIQECIASLNTLKEIEKYKNAEIRLLQYYAGEVASKLQTLTKKNFAAEIKKITGYSYSYAKFLIQLYTACKKFLNLRFTTISTLKLRNNFSELNKLMENDLLFWSPPEYAVDNVSTVGDVSTPTTESSMSTD